MSFDKLKDSIEYYLTWKYLSDSDIYALGLRPLSRNKMNRALNVLEQIFEHVVGKAHHTRKYYRTLDILSNKYFRIMPAKSPKLIDTKTKITVELATCDYVSTVFLR